MIINKLKNRAKFLFEKISGKRRLEGEGERVDIIYGKIPNFDKLDVYQKSHLRRYEFARKKIVQGSVCGDFACGTGYGSLMLAEKANKVIGADINRRVIEEIKKRYRKYEKVEYVNLNLLKLDYQEVFDYVVSFETIEHFTESDILKLMNIFLKALKPGGKLIFSTPYMQEKTEAAIKMGFHLTFYINEQKIQGWLKNSGFDLENFFYQNYKDHEVESFLEKKDFIICIASKAR